MKQILLLSFMLLMSGCTSEKKNVSRAVFAWKAVEGSDKNILDKYQIDTILMDIKHYSAMLDITLIFWLVIRPEV